MINNRQAGRRNRGRNNGRQSGGNRGGDNGNRIDSRARGNAPQLLEKYRNMARDAQLAGDRVNTEYYLQFADHYFRVIADNRARQEEHQARFRRNDDSLDDYGDQGDVTRDDADDATETVRDRDEGRQRRDDSRDRSSRIRVAADDREEEREAEQASDHRRTRKPSRIAVDASSSYEEAQDEAGAEQDTDPAPKRATRGRKPRQPRAGDRGNEEAEAPRLDLAALPPAIVRADNDSDDGNEGEVRKPAPRRRGRPPKASAEAAE